ncbi:hypothetical protein FA13DRAFT_548060 [Coprinellus micaceus]|uniref:Uncharacterized protein n=1 Tax=Coprinellus micaceus TaxID=71717 RepID=A0A4Y7T8U1_COPMI|nr:hypothetical protein FA13DRAFT_548060 [Coprinellus micaceus]
MCRRIICNDPRAVVFLPSVGCLANIFISVRLSYVMLSLGLLTLSCPPPPSRPYELTSARIISFHRLYLSLTPYIICSYFIVVFTLSLPIPPFYLFIIIYDISQRYQRISTSQLPRPTDDPSRRV